MQRIKTATAVTSKPAYSADGTPGFFTKGDAVAGTQATVLGQDWPNMIQEELVNVLVAAGVVPDAEDDSQLAQAIIRLIAASAYTPSAASETVAGITTLATLDAALAGEGNGAIIPEILHGVLTAALANMARTDAVNAWTRQVYMTQVSLLAVSGSLIIDLDTQAALSLQIVGSTTIANPGHTGTQKLGRLMLAASATHSLSWGSAWKSSSTVTLPTVTIAGATIVLDYVCIDGTMYPLWMSTLGLVLSNTDIAPLATISSTGTLNGSNVLANLVDGNNATQGSYSGGSPPSFIFDFSAASPRNIWKLRLGLNAGSYDIPCRLVYSDDGSTWNPTNQSAIYKALESTITDYLVDNYGQHRFWALQATSGTWIQFTTVEFYPRIGG